MTNRKLSSHWDRDDDDPNTGANASTDGDDSMGEDWICVPASVYVKNTNIYLHIIAML